MATLLQRTLSGPSPEVCGVGLHSGSAIRMRIVPAGCGEGISFVRTDINGGARIRLRAGNVGDTMLATTIEEGGAKVSTIEHLLFAMCICGVDNATVEIDGPEVPIMDGSARPFVLVLRDTGLAEQERPKRFIRIKKRVEVGLDGEPGRHAAFEPAQAPSWSVSVSYRNPVISRTAQDFDHGLGDHAASVSRVAGARTFGFVRDVDLLRSRQRALGGTLDNAVVIDGGRVLNAGGLRQDDEFVAHKMLDVIGDCYTEGKLVLGRYSASMPGHALNNRLMRELLADEESWEDTEADAMDADSLPDFGPLRATL